MSFKEKGSFSLEYLMLITGVIVATLTLPLVFNYIDQYSNNYSETTVINN